MISHNSWWMLAADNSNSLLLKLQSTLHSEQKEKKANFLSQFRYVENLSSRVESWDKLIIYFLMNVMNYVWKGEQINARRRRTKLIKQEACLLYQLLASGLFITTRPDVLSDPSPIKVSFLFAIESGTTFNRFRIYGFHYAIQSSTALTRCKFIHRQHEKFLRKSSNCQSRVTFKLQYRNLW